MKKLLWLGLCGVMTAVAWAAEPLARRVTAEEFRAAGLEKLSPAELAQLDALFQKYGTANAAPAASGAAQEQAAAREAAQVAKAEQKKSEASFLEKAKKLLTTPGAKGEVVVFETEIAGGLTAESH